MKEENLFNPIPLPENLKPGPPPSTDDANTQQRQTQDPILEDAKTKPGRKPKRPAKPRKTQRPVPKANDQTRWQRIKGRLAAKLATMDRAKLREVLIACGLAVGVVAVIMLAIKFLPYVLLGLLGLAVLLRVWDRLRHPPFPI